MNKVRVKICGITRLDDALAAIESGADALGFVFYAPSPRAVTVEQAASIIRQLPPFVTTTALFVNETAEQVETVIAETGIDLLQFHGDESPEYCGQFQRPYFKALRMAPEIDVQVEAEKYHDARAVLLDAYRPGVPGGTGEVFNWDRIPENLNKPLILAGGLDHTNVYQAVTQVEPYAVDVSGGVELSKGVKDKSKITLFMREVARAN